MWRNGMKIKCAVVALTTSLITVFLVTFRRMQNYQVNNFTVEFSRNLQSGEWGRGLPRTELVNLE